MAIYHGTIRKKSPQTNPRKNEPSIAFSRWTTHQLHELSFPIDPVSSTVLDTFDASEIWRSPVAMKNISC